MAEVETADSGVELEGSSVAGVETTTPDPQKEELIQSILKDVPENMRKTLEYGLRHLPRHLRQSERTEEEVRQTLEEINFPKELWGEPKPAE